MKKYFLFIMLFLTSTFTWAGDGESDTAGAADIVNLINSMLGNSSSADADVNGDGIVNIADVVFLLNMALPSEDGIVINKVTTPVVEEITGTWCGYCPIGTVGLKRTKEIYGDKVITIALHTGDIMDVDAFDNVINMNTSGGVPASLLNRKNTDVYPHYSVLDYYCKLALQEVADGYIGAVAKWTDESKTNFEVKTAVEMDETSGINFSIGFALVANGLKGEGSNWAQSNYLAGDTYYAEDPYMGYLTQLGEKIYDIEYDHVAIAGWGADYGIEGSQNQKSFSQTLSLSNIRYDLVQDKDKLSVVVYLLNSATGEIVNATQIGIK